MNTHFTASLTAAGVSTAMTQPVDVIKTRMMNAAPGTYSGLCCIFVLHSSTVFPREYETGLEGNLRNRKQVFIDKT